MQYLKALRAILLNSAEQCTCKSLSWNRRTAA